MVYMGSEVVQFIEGQMLGRVFFELGVRGGGGNFIVIFWWRFAHPILTHLKYWKCPMARVRDEIYFCFLVFESLGVFLTAFCLSFSRAFLYKAFWVLETAS